MIHRTLGRSERAMPKRILFALALAALGLAACGGVNPNAFTAAPTPTPTAAVYVPNPNITAAPVTFTVAKTPIPNQPISESTPDANGRPGTPIATATTDPTGKVTFSGLTPTQAYCWTTTYSVSGTSNTYTDCTLQWQGGVALGN